MKDQWHKTSRLYCPALTAGRDVSLSPQAAHYLKNVMRKSPGDFLRLFNELDGEFSAEINMLSKKEARCLVGKQLRAPTDTDDHAPKITLAFPLLPKDRLDFLIEKAVELGVSALQPLIFDHSSVRKMKEERITAQIIEAAEQCERLDIPSLAPLTKLLDFTQGQSGIIITALERENAPSLSETYFKEERNLTYLIGPEGGFSDSEKTFLLQQKHVHAVSLGSRILRAETAALCGLSILVKD